MEYTNNQIRLLLSINEEIGMVRTLARVYHDFDNKEIDMYVFTDKNRIYKIYCSFLFNVVKEIKNASYLFGKTKRYNEFLDIINQKYIGKDTKYYSKDNYEATLYKILESIRNQVNHATKPSDDNNPLFRINVSFELLENLMNILFDIYMEVYCEVDESKIKELVLSKPEIQYSIDDFLNKRADFNSKILEASISAGEQVMKNNTEALTLFNEIFDPVFLVDVINKNPEAVARFNSISNTFKEKYMIEKNSINNSDIKEVTALIDNLEKSKSINDFNSVISDIKKAGKKKDADDE